MLWVINSFGWERKATLTPALSQGERGNVRGQMGAVGWHGFAPPPRRRVELNGSGAPSGMTAQPQLVQGPNRLWMSKARPDLAREQGCSKRTLAGAMDGEGQRPICGVPSDPESEARETAVGGRLGGGEDFW